MEIARELIKIVSRNKRRGIKILGEDTGDTADQLEKLYGILSDDREVSDQEIQERFYSGDKAKQFNNLLLRLRRRLLNMLFLIDAKEGQYANQESTLANTWKNLAAAKILIRYHAYHAAEDVVERTIEPARRVENYEVVAELFRIRMKIRARRGEMNFVTTDFERYQDYQQRAVQLATTEYLFLKVTSRLHSNKMLPEELVVPIQEALDQIETCKRKMRSDRLMVYEFLLRYYLAAQRHEYEEVHRIAKQAIAELEGSSSVSTEIMGSFYHIVMVSAAATGVLEESTEIAHRAERYLTPYSLNWVVGREFRVLIYLYSARYADALALYQETVTNVRFKKLELRTRENWLVIEAFLHLLLLSGDLEEDPALPLPRFRLSKFVNSLEIGVKDKLGFNTTVHLLQILFLLQNGEWEMRRTVSPQPISTHSGT